MNTNKWYNKIEFAIIVVLFTMMVCITFFNVISRFCFHFTLSWTEQFSRFLFVWVTYAGISWAGGINAHLRVYALCEALGKKLGYYLILFGDIITMGFGVYMAYKIFGLMRNAFALNQTFPSMQWCNVGWMYLAGVLGMAGLTIRILQSRVILHKQRRLEKTQAQDK